MMSDDECSVVFSNVTSQSRLLQTKESAHRKKLVQLIKAAEENKANVVKRLLRDNRFDLSVDDADQFGWTALMCACCSGASDVVKALLELNANIQIRNNAGETCTLIAQKRGQAATLRTLSRHASNNFNVHHKTHDKNSVTVITSSDSDGESEVIYFCDLCQQTLPLASQMHHLSSTVHLFNLGLKSQIPVDTPAKYDISECNKGYQMMLKSGWNKNKGLGINEDGAKYPLKTIIKRDRCGLGAKKYRGSVTHSLTKEVTSKKLTGGQHNLKEIRKTEKLKEIELRRSLS